MFVNVPFVQMYTRGGVFLLVLANFTQSVTFAVNVAIQFIGRSAVGSRIQFCRCIHLRDGVHC